MGNAPKRRCRSQVAHRERVLAAAGVQKPSLVADRYWLYATRKKGKYPSHTKRGGKWLIFVPVQNIDAAWDKIRRATEDGQLGEISKVATGKPNPNARDPGVKVICVYTYDSEDERDVWRVRQKLRDLGFTNTLFYKTDAATYAGKYAKHGHRGVSKFRG